MIQSPQDKLIVSVTSKYIKDFSTLTKRMALENATSVHLEDMVNIVGTVVSLPRSISKLNIDNGYSMDDIKVGDMLIFSFSVIYDFYQKEHEGELLFRNRIFYNGKDYWMADISKVFAIIRGEEIIMINGFVMAETYEEDKIFTQPEAVRSKKTKSSKVIWVGKPRTNKKPINIKRGDTIYYNPKKTQKYQINNKPFIILTQQHVLGKVN